MWLSQELLWPSVWKAWLAGLPTCAHSAFLSMCMKMCIFLVLWFFHNLAVFCQFLKTLPTPAFKDFPFVLDCGWKLQIRWVSVDQDLQLFCQLLFSWSKIKCIKKKTNSNPNPSFEKSFWDGGVDGGVSKFMFTWIMDRQTFVPSVCSSDSTSLCQSQGTKSHQGNNVSLYPPQVT